MHVFRSGREGVQSALERGSVAGLACFGQSWPGYGALKWWQGREDLDL